MGTTPGTDAHGHPDVPVQNEAVAHERSDINVRGVIWFVVTLVVIAVVIHVGIVGLFKVFDREERTNDPFVTPLAAPSGSLPPALPQPVLQTTPWLDLKQFRADEDAYLGSYGWVDQKGGVARLPIDKAKALLLQRGLPARTGQQDASEGTHGFAMGESSGGRSIPAGGADLSSPPAPAQSNPATTPAPATRLPATTKGPGK